MGTKQEDAGIFVCAGDGEAFDQLTDPRKVDMHLVLSQAKDSKGVVLTLEPGLGGGIILDCSRDHRGNPRYIELPRTYKTPRGARQAAALLTGERLAWGQPDNQ